MRLVIATMMLLATLNTLALADDPCAQPSPEAMAEELGVKLPRRPWHVANIWWNFAGPVEKFTSLEMDVAIDRDVPETYNLYISPCGIAKINGLQFYGGIQTNINGWASKEDRERVSRGRGAIFSRWSSDKKTPIGLDHVRMVADDCLVESAGYEGEFASVRRPFKWKKGSYTWSVTKGDTIERNGEPATWFACQVKDHADDSTFDVGSLLFEGDEFTFWGRHSAFVEVYSTREIPRSSIPKVNITFGWPRINGEKVAIQGTSAFYPGEKSGATSSPDCAHIRAKGDSCVVEVGPIFQREESKRRHEVQIR